MTLAIVLNAILAAAVFVVVIAHHVWSIVTQHGDRPHVFAAPRRSGQLGLRHRPAEPRPVRTRPDARPGQAWPAA